MGIRAAGNITVVYNGTDITGNLDTASLNGVVNQIDDTVLTSDAVESIPGIPDWEVPVGGKWNATLDGLLAPDMINPPAARRDLVVTIGGVSYTWTQAAFITDYRINANNPREGITWSGTLKCSGNPTRA